MKIQLMGTQEEMKEAIEQLQILFEVSGVSKESLNQSDSDTKVYADLIVPKRNRAEKDVFRSVSAFHNELKSACLVLVNSDDEANVIGGFSNPLGILKILTFMLSNEFKQYIEELWDTNLKKLLNDGNLPSEYKERISNNAAEIRKTFIITEESPKC